MGNNFLFTPQFCGIELGPNSNFKISEPILDSLLGHPHLPHYKEATLVVVNPSFP